MEDTDCITVEKQFVDRIPQTIYHLTGTGRETFEAYVRTLESLVMISIFCIRDCCFSG